MVFESLDFSDADTEFCVRIDAKNDCDNSTIQGLPFCQTVSESDFYWVNNLYSTYEGSSILVSLNTASIGEFLVERKFEGGNYSIIDRTQESLLDASAFLGRKYSYRVSYLDTCDGNWDENFTSPPQYFCKGIGN